MNTENVRKGQKIVLLSILGQLALIPLNLIAGENTILLLLALVIGLAALVVGFIGLLKVLAGLQVNMVLRVLYCLLLLIPFAGLIMLALVNQKATAHLRETGHKVGFLGAAPLE